MITRLKTNAQALANALTRLGAESHERLVIRTYRGTPWLVVEDRAVALDARIEGHGTVHTYAESLTGLSEGSIPDEQIVIEQHDERIRVTHAHGRATLGATHEGVRTPIPDTPPRAEPDVQVASEALQHLVALVPRTPAVTVRGAGGWLALISSDETGGLHTLARVQATTRGETSVTVLPTELTRATPRDAGDDVHVWITPTDERAIYLQSARHRSRVRALETSGDFPSIPDETGWRTRAEFEVDACALHRFTRYARAEHSRVTAVVTATRIGDELVNEDATITQVHAHRGPKLRTRLRREASRQAAELLVHAGAKRVRIQERCHNEGAHTRWRLTPTDARSGEDVDLMCTVTAE